MCVKDFVLRACLVVLFSSLSLSIVACNSPSTGSGAGSGTSNGSNSLVLVSGDKQSGLSGSPLSAPIVAQVLDPNGSPLSGVNVYASVTSGGGSITSQVLSSDANGMVSLGWTLGKPLGVDTLNIILFSDMYSSNPGVTVTASRMAGVAVAGNSSITAVGPLKADGVSTCMITVTLLDSNHQALIGTVPAISASGVNQYTQCTPVNTEGVSTCLMKSTMSGTKTLSITSPINLNGGTVVFNPGVPAKLSITGYVNNLLSVQVEDAFSNPISAQAVDWTVTMGGGSMGGGSSVKTDATGTASNQLEPIASGVQNISVQVHGTSLPAQTFKLDLGVWTFNSGTLATTTLGNNIDFSTANVCELTPGNAPDHSAASLTTGTANGITYGTLSDGTSTGFKLGPATSGACDGRVSNCSNELDPSWAPEWANIVGYWKFNESAFGTAPGGTDFKDSSSAGVSNGVHTGGVVAGAGGKLGNGITMDGTGLITLPNSATLAAAGNTLSIFTWIYPNTTSGWQSIISGNGQIILSYVNGSLTWADSTNWCYDCTGYYPGVVANQWQQIGFVKNAAGYTFYVNGQVVGTKAINSYQYQQSGPLYIGFDVASQGRFNGDMDELAIWKTALTNAEVQTIYQRQSQSARYVGTFQSRVLDSFKTVGNWTSLSWVPTLPFFKELPASGANETTAAYSSLANNTLMNGIVGLWHMDESAGATAFADSSGNNNHATSLTNVTLGNPGKLGNAGSFNGSTSYAQGSLNGASLAADFTISAWINHSSMTDWGAIFSNNVTTNGSPILTMIDNTTSVGTNQAGVNGQAISLDLGADHYNKWIFVTLRRQGQTLYVDAWKDGTHLSSSGAIYWTMTTSNQFYIGKHYSGGPQVFAGQIDEVGVWSRSLSSTELAQVYLRGASRVKFQVKSCALLNCSDGTWQGPDGTANTYFTELDNTSSYNTTTNAPAGSVNLAAPNLAFTSFSGQSNLAKRYFQYRSVFESDTSTTTLMPEVKSMAITPVHFDSTSPTVIGQSGIVASSLTSFVESLGSNGCSGVTYNLGVGNSSSSATWYYWNSSTNTWMVSSGATATSSPATLVNSNLSSFPASGTQTIYVKAFLNSTGTTACELQSIQLNGHS